MLDGSQRVLAAREYGVQLLRCLPVENLQQALAHMEPHTLRPSEMAWRAYHLNQFGKRTGRQAVKAETNGDKPQIMRTVLAKWFGVNEQVIYRLCRIYQLIAEDDQQGAGNARDALKRLDEGASSLGNAYGALFPTRSRLNRNPEVAKIISDAVNQITSPAEQRRAYTNAMASLQGITVALMSLREPSSQLTIDELDAWNKSLAGSRTTLNRMARILSEAITSRRKEDT